MKRLSLSNCVAVAAVVLILSSGIARADSFFFSFSNDPLGGNVPGTVTGELLGLPHNGTGPATSVLIDSYPAGLVQFGSYTPPFDVLAWSGSVDENGFTVVNGAITTGSFSITGANGVNDQLYINSQCACLVFGLGLGTNFFDIGSNDTLFVWNDNGMGQGGVTFTNANGTVPEPGTMVLLGAGLVGLVGRRLWKQRHA